MIERVLVKYRGEHVGVLEQTDPEKAVRFQYMPEFIQTGIELSPIKMPLSDKIYSFPELSAAQGYENTFKALPGLIADVLPEKFGDKLLSTWFSRHGLSIDDLGPLGKLCYLGNRGMGALEFEPEISDIKRLDEKERIEVSELVEVARQVLAEHNGTHSSLSDDEMETLISIGTSAGGAKAKALIAWNRDSNEVVSGLGDAPDGFEHWLIKFDEFDNEEHASAAEIGRIEYAYSQMAADAGIEMMESRLFETQGLAHFMTRRFDRLFGSNRKTHVQTLCGLAHFDRNPPGNYGYEDLFNVARRMGCNQLDQEELFRRMVFNIATRNQDDHTKNHAFIMEEDGSWFPSPAYDLCFSYKPGNRFISSHQMSCNGKRDGFTHDDLLAAAKVADVKDPQRIINQVMAAVDNWPAIAKRVGLSQNKADYIGSTFRLEVAKAQPLLGQVAAFREDKDDNKHGKDNTKLSL